MRHFSFIFFALFTLLTLASGAHAATPTTGYERLFYFREGEYARDSYFSHPDQIDVFAPQSYSVNAKGELAGTVADDLVSFAAKHKIKVMPLVTNTGFSRATSGAFLASTNAQTKAINALVKEAQKKGYAGWQFDFEQMNATDRDAYTSFVKRASVAFKAKGLTLSVAVIAQLSATPTDYPLGSWDKVVGVYDYKALAQYADFLSIMSYDAPNTGGPIAPYAWTQQVLAWSLKQAPAAKFSLGIPTYYWKWDDASGKLVGIGNAGAGVENVLAMKGTKERFDSKTKEAYIKYTDASGKKSTLWYANDDSVAAKVALAKKSGLRGVSFWTLGLEVPEIYKVLK